ncbi:hypothetical protein [Amycolatopsis sp. CFH S0078]|uniref:hypothetical protein n=1 Tax=Amycolatopsis sp. CFH S0078 TaxID=1644108 RepID=UPI00106ED464|nr:hypothetical protein [Amycolatopsis sp. CFH S0078]
MATNPVVTSVDDIGFSLCGARTLAITAAGTVVVKAAPGRLCRVIVTASAAGQVTFYDNASTGSGTVLAATAATPAVGTVYEFQAPAVNGITAVAGATPASVTVVWS